MGLHMHATLAVSEEGFPFVLRLGFDDEKDEQEQREHAPRTHYIDGYTDICDAVNFPLRA